QKLRRASLFEQPILLIGESGVGKELLAREIHKSSPRKGKDFFPVNCANFSRELIASELFGYTKGAFTGADRDEKGIFEKAEGGIVFLDEIGELDISLQANLLRVIQENKIRKVGDNKEIPVNIQLISATNRNLHQEVNNHRFRKDLLYRLNTLTFNIPPLRERVEDIEPLAEFFMDKYNRLFTAKADDYVMKKLDKSAIDYLKTLKWSGNIRELEQLIQRVAIWCDNKSISKKDLSEYHEPEHNDENSIDLSDGLNAYLTNLEKEIISSYLKNHNYRQNLVAEKLKIGKDTLNKKIKRLGIIVKEESLNE
ncbi:MAG: sigma-54 dependent transcriptional regulator, partial [Candidatus Cloacimonetes bacterium]|nr:sigma-54 dependent transcriptional regulator [Candidatus Cloacimonadota bacterium]